MNKVIYVPYEYLQSGLCIRYFRAIRLYINYPKLLTWGGNNQKVFV